EIHIDKNPVETINPKIIIFVFVPTTEIIVKAIRRCKFHFSIAKAIINPPIIRRLFHYRKLKLFHSTLDYLLAETIQSAKGKLLELVLLQSSTKQLSNSYLLKQHAPQDLILQE